MGMPIITPGTGSRCQAVTDLIQSVALQETALSHILNAEGAKMQKIIASNAGPALLLELNNSVIRLIGAATRLEMIFQSKLELFADEKPCGIAEPPVIMPAMAELAKISVTNIESAIPLTEARDAAIERIIQIAQTQVSLGYRASYTVNFTASGYDSLTGGLAGKFTVINNNNPADVAADDEGRMVTVTYLPAADAKFELAKVDITTVAVTLPLVLYDAGVAAAAQIELAAQAQVAAGYTVTLDRGGYSGNGFFRCLFIVTNASNPADTAKDSALREISVTSALPAAEELSKIGIGSITVNVPLDGGDVLSVVLAGAVKEAQAQISTGYTVSVYEMGGFYSNKFLDIKFAVTSNYDPSDLAVDTSIRPVEVYSSVK
ncbi:MAG: hypothetical protein LBV08_09605 [Clostridiales bacterium]|jgi:hypothetical protein|nr:hypothetical protein [Clostridiales bacterium]